MKNTDRIANGLRVIFPSMPEKDLKILSRMMDTEPNPNVPHFYTVEEWIAEHPETVIGRRVSKKGIALVSVQYPACDLYPDGAVRHYEEERLATTCSYMRKEEAK